jgi:hypothetical protein
MFHFAARRVTKKEHDMNIKDGWKTTEFWLTLISVLISGAVALGALPTGEGEQLQSGLVMIVTGVFTVAPVIAYIWNRARVKAAAIERGM